MQRPDCVDKSVFKTKSFNVTSPDHLEILVWFHGSAFPRNITHHVCLCLSVHFSRLLFLQAEGIEQTFSTSLLVQTEMDESFYDNVTFTFPADVVEGSQRVSLTVVGM